MLKEPCDVGSNPTGAARSCSSVGRATKNLLADLRRHHLYVRTTRRGRQLQVTESLATHQYLYADGLSIAVARTRRWRF